MIGGALGSRRELLTQDECVARNHARLVVALTVLPRLTLACGRPVLRCGHSHQPQVRPLFLQGGISFAENDICVAAMPTTGISWMTGSGLTTI
eukprot:COSAG04_NODE_14245_length_575_cov_66.773109_2_plen_92_part_01